MKADRYAALVEPVARRRLQLGMQQWGCAVRRGGRTPPARRVLLLRSFMVKLSSEKQPEIIKLPFFSVDRSERVAVSGALW